MPVTQEQISAAISEYVKSGGRRTKAENVRALLEMINTAVFEQGGGPSETIQVKSPDDTTWQLGVNNDGETVWTPVVE